MARSSKEDSDGNSRERVTLSMSKLTKKRLAKLQEKTDADSMAEVVRLSLAVYDHLLRLQESGYQLEVVSPESKERAPLFLFPHLSLGAELRP